MDVAEYRKMYELEGKYWWWVGRRRILRTILNKLSLGSIVILDVGCGTGANLSCLRDYGTVTGVDISESAIDFCKKRGFNNVVQGDAEKLDFEDNTFDLITALDLLEHLDDNRALGEFHRVLKPAGYLVVTAPAFDFLWSQHNEALHHKRRYTRGGLRNVLESHGFVIEKLSCWNTFLFLPILAKINKKTYEESGN
jgi:SAM-dependent methyltransferase